MEPPTDSLERRSSTTLSRHKLLHHLDVQCWDDGYVIWQLGVVTCKGFEAVAKGVEG